MNCTGTPPKWCHQGSFLGPHMCASYTIIPSRDKRWCQASLSLSQALFCCTFQHEEACEWHLSRVPWCCAALPWLGVLGPGWAAEDTCVWAPSWALLVEEKVPESVPCGKWRSWWGFQVTCWAKREGYYSSSPWFKLRSKSRGWRIEKWYLEWVLERRAERACAEQSNSKICVAPEKAGTCPTEAICIMLP